MRSGRFILVGLLCGVAGVASAPASGRSTRGLRDALTRELGLTRASTQLATSLAKLDRERASLEYTAAVLDHAARESMRRLDAYRSRRSARERAVRTRARALYKLARGGLARLVFEATGPGGRGGAGDRRVLTGRSLRLLVRHDLAELSVYRRAEQRAAAELVSAARELQSLGAISMVGAVQEHALVSAEHAIHPNLRATLARRRRLVSRAGEDVSREHKALLRVVKTSWAELTSLRGLDGAPRLVRPVQGPVVGPFGAYTDRVLRLPMIRNGVEIAARPDAPVHAMADGRVVAVTALAGYENVVVVGHGGGQYTLTARLWDVAVGPGDEVRAGTVLGHVAAKSVDDGLGRTVYVELRHGEKPVDPTAYLRRARAR